MSASFPNLLMEFLRNFIMKNKLGLIINPIAGVGGKAGYKGSDDRTLVDKALIDGIKPEASEKAIRAIKFIEHMNNVDFVTYPGKMGENALKATKVNYTVIGNIKDEYTNSNDTIKAAKDMVEYGVDLIIFAGGDGTARDIYNAVQDNVPVLGIPAGVKIYSAVYANNPPSAGKVIAMFLQGQITSFKDSEVMDINEEEFRQGRVNTKLYGFMKVPNASSFVQNVKSGGYSNEKKLHGIANEIITNMDEDTFYIIGPGTTTGVILKSLELPNTLLGIDIVKNKRLIAADVNEQTILSLIKGGKAKIIVTAIGGQGHIFGRGNQQISPRVIKQIGKENIIVIATTEKLLSLANNQLVVDTGSNELDEKLIGHIKVLTGFKESTFFKVSM